MGIQTESSRKYRILAEAHRHKHSINFNVLYDARERLPMLLEEELGTKEGEFIRARMPPLNKQIPRPDNWRSYEINETANTITLSEILSQQNT